MVVARHVRPALFVLAATLAFFAQVEATSATSVSLSSCVASCVKAEGCETSDAKCVCKGAKSNLLDHVAVCMYYSCPDEIRTFDATFMTPLASVCKTIGKAIPQSKIDEADETAQTFADKLPSTSKTQTTSTTSAKATPKTTLATSESKKTTAAATTSTEPAETESSSTSSVDDETTTISSTTTDSTPTPATSATSATTTLAIAPDSPTRAATQSSTSTKGAAKSDPTDSSPFASPPNAAGRSTTSWILASLPLALAVAMR